MSSLAARLRGVIAGGKWGRESFSEDSSSTGPATRELSSENDSRPHFPRDAVADVLGGDWHESGGQRFLVIDRSYAPGHRHGRVAMADAMPPSDGLWPALSLLAGAPQTSRAHEHLLFIDLETTGLAGGAGTYAFLVGCAWFVPGGIFRIRQFFLSSFAAERVLLDAVRDVASAAGTVVTYNGKTFDLPLLDTRFVIHRMETPFSGMPHVDMLHPARRLWRAEDDGREVSSPYASGGPGASSSCRLSAVEQTICGHFREGDVPGFEIPARYFHYVRSGDASPLGAVLEHNRLDLLSLALLTSRAAQLLEEGPASARTAREAFGLGRLYERGGLMSNACACFARAAGLPGSEHLDDRRPSIVAEALRAYALLSRRERLYDDAAGAWRRIIDLRRCPPHIVREATDALAVHHEHRLRDPGAARTFALQALQFQGSVTRRAALHHRLTRLDRKLGASASHAALF